MRVNDEDPFWVREVGYHSISDDTATIKPRLKIIERNT